MPLKIELKPGERLIVGNALITNDKERIKFYIEGNVPILREKFVLTAKEANTPCKRIYYLVQEMYLAKNPIELHEDYFKRIREVTEAAPSMIPLIDSINKEILAGDYYAALKQTMSLIGREKEMLDLVKNKKTAE